MRTGLLRLTLGLALGPALSVSAVPLAAQAAAPANPAGLAQTLQGTWDSTAYTSMQNGHIVGKLTLKPNSMVFTFRKDASWQMRASEGTTSEHHGRYELRGSELIMKEADGSTYQDFKLEVLDAGRQLSMSDADVVLLLSRMPGPAGK